MRAPTEPAAPDTLSPWYEPYQLPNPPSNGFSPKIGELGRDDLIVGNRSREQTDGLSKTVHMGNGLFSDGWIVVREITPDQFRDEFSFGRGKALFAHFCRSAH